MATKTPAPKIKKKEDQLENANPKFPELIKDEETGETSGIILPNGDAFVGLSQRDLRFLAENEKRKRETSLESLGAVTPEARATERERAALIENQSLRSAELVEEDFTELRPKDFKALTEKDLKERTGFDPISLNPMQDVRETLSRPEGQAAAATAFAGAAIVGSGGLAALPLGSAIAKMGVGAKLLGLAGFTTIFSLLTSGRIKQLESDIDDQVGLVPAVAKDVRNGADPYQALEELNKLEEEIRWKIGDLNVAISRSPKDRIQGKNTQEFARRRLEKVQRTKFAIERYLIDGDPRGLDLAAGVSVIDESVS